jgi:tetratricopeptide (TPR) repeat protein
VEIAKFTEKIPENCISIPAAKVFLESGFPATAREIAQKAVRRTNTSQTERIQLEMLMCSSLIEQGKRSVALKTLKKLEPMIQESVLSQSEQAEYLDFVARTLFLLGRYREASKPFAQSAGIHEQSGAWESAARAYFNAAASLDNAGGDKTAKNGAFELVERCRTISLTHDLRGPLAHCEAFYGHNDYWRGNFAGAREHFRKALGYIPTNDRGYRRLHLLSMLAFTYLRTGRFGLAQKFGNETLRLAATEQSERFSTRYENLQAELMWEDGKILESQDLRIKCLANMSQTGISVLEELSMYSRALLQASVLGQTQAVPRPSINEQLRKNNSAWSEYLFAAGLCALSEGRLEDSKNAFHECIHRSEIESDKYHAGQGLLGLIQLGFVKRAPLEEISENYRRLKIYAAHMVETPLRVHVLLVEAGLAYRSGKFDEAFRSLKIASRISGLGWVENFALAAWMATCEGKAVRIHHEWQKDVLARFTKIYFSPSLEETSKDAFTVSGNYSVDLTRHPSLAEVIRYLMSTSTFAASPEVIQSEVWKQSLAQQGWRQKIRNTVMRIRQAFPMTMAPIILHSDQVALYSEAISIRAKVEVSTDPHATILRLLRDGPLSSLQLSNRLSVSNATTKRLLKKLAEEDKISVFKFGRNVLYQTFESSIRTDRRNAES